MQKVWNFNLLAETYVKEADGVLCEYEHSQTGAKLLYLKTENRNKLFAVTFKTIPENSTGVFHILEHSVFCGSEKYPVRDPFLEMEKGSVNTFLNAMTFPDHTVYPVSSRNEKDFHNLISIYLDAVFRPNIYQNEYVFMQEGWHYEFNGDAVSVNGVVLNEMKGVEASVDSRIGQGLMELLFPDTCYQFASGGKSEDIPKLTYEEYLKAHSRYYRPEHAIFYLEGDLDLDRTVSQIEEYMLPQCPAEALSDIEKPAAITVQKPTLPRTKQIEYPIMEGESAEDQWFYAAGKILDDPDLPEEARRLKACAGRILAEYLTASMEAPLQQGILMNQLGQSVEMMIDTGLQQSYLMIKVRNSTQESLPAIKELLQELPSLVQDDPFFKVQLAAVITNLEFHSHVKEEPEAVGHLMAVLDNYLYGGTACGNLETDKLYRKLRELLGTDYYEKLLVELLDLNTLSWVIARPSSGKAEEEKLQEASYLRALCEQWDDSFRQKLEDKTLRLEQWQQTPDPVSAIQQIPKLSLADLDDLPKKEERILGEYKGVQLILHPASLEDMAYLDLYFPIPAKYQDSLCHLSLINNLFTNLPTTQYDAMTLYQKIQEVTGDLHLEFLPVQDMTRGEESGASCTVYLAVKTSFLKKNADEVIALLEEILFHTRWDDAEMIGNILLQIMDMFRYDLIENGSAMGVRKVLAGWSAVGLAKEMLDGTSCMDSLQALLEAYDTEADSFLQYVREVVGDVFVRDKMTVGIAYPKNDPAEDYKYQILIDRIPEKGNKDIHMKISCKRENTVIPIPADTGFAAAGARIEDVTTKKIAAWRVACHILSTEYLWQKIRVQGGAYGTAIQIGIAGDISFYTYRDPNGAASLEILQGCTGYLEDFVQSENDLEPYIISALAKTDPLLGIRESSYQIFQDELNGIRYEARSEIYRAMTKVSKDDLACVAQEMRTMIGQMTNCLIAG